MTVRTCPQRTSGRPLSARAHGRRAYRERPSSGHPRWFGGWIRPPEIKAPFPRLWPERGLSPTKPYAQTGLKVAGNSHCAAARAKNLWRYQGSGGSQFLASTSRRDGARRRQEPIGSSVARRNTSTISALGRHSESRRPGIEPEQHSASKFEIVRVRANVLGRRMHIAEAALDRARFE